MKKEETLQCWVMNRDELQKDLGLKGPIGRWISNRVYDFLKLDTINSIQNRVRDFSGAEFADVSLKELGVIYEVGEGQLKYIPSEGGFIVMANHHFGSLDGMILEAVFGNPRPDFKIMTTFLLSKIPGMHDLVIPVDNFTTGKARSFNGIRTAMKHLSDGHPLGLFPAGEVATWQPRKRRTSLGRKRMVEDIPWSGSVIKMAQRSGLPIIPVYFEGTNSRIFHILGKIHPRLRTIMLSREMLNKQGTKVNVRIGQPIQPEEISALEPEAAGKYLRSRSYALQAQLTASAAAVNHEWPEPVAPRTDPAMVKAEVDALPADKILFETGDYRMYLLRSSEAPTLMKELYRLREETFRAVGEGTGQPFDTDRYDEYYYQLILWNIPNGEITGAYRLGDCKDIVDKYGVEGIYSASLYKYKEAAKPVLSKCIELGRSFVARKYQKEVNPLRLLLAGIATATLRMPDAEYFLGPVSISNDYPAFYKSLAVHYLSHEFPLDDASKIVEPSHPFVSDFLAVNPDDLLMTLPKGDIAKFDRLLASISDGRYHLPVLVRKYFSCSARLACFNVDPDFSDSLDGLILLRLAEFPKNTVRSILRGMTDELREAVNVHFFGSYEK